MLMSRLPPPGRAVAGIALFSYAPAMSLNPLAPVVDYQSMLNRIFWFTTAAALGAVWMLRTNIPALDVQLAQLDGALALSGAKALPISAGYLLPALVFATVARVFRLHARIADWLAIREHFDIEIIIREFARQLQIDLGGIDDHDLRRARHQIMRSTFYQFVSGAQPAIDPQLVHQALDAWSWFWVGLEAACVMIWAGLGLISGRVYLLGFETLAATLALSALVLPALHRQCRRFASAQVRTILADPVRATAVRSALDALTATMRPRRAA